MRWQFTPYIIPLLIAAFISVTLALYAWRRRGTTPAAPSFALLMLAVAEWSAGYVLELGSTDLPTALFWAKVEYLGIVSVSLAWLAFALQFANQDKWLTRRNLLLSAIVPDITLLMIWTNEAHGLMWRRIALDTADPTLAENLREEADLVLIKPISFIQLRDLATRLRPPDRMG